MGARRRAQRLDDDSASRLKRVEPRGMRPGGYTDSVWRDPSPHNDPAMRSVLGRRTLESPCSRCHGVVVQFTDGYTTCTKKQADGGCLQWWFEKVKAPE